MTTETDDESRALFWEALANTLRPYAGWFFFGFGALFVLIGYLGISGEAVVAKQLPYLISGGLGGVLLAILGGYFLAMEELRKDGGRLDRMERQIEELHRVLLERPDAPPVEAPVPSLSMPAPAEPGSNGAAHRVVVVPSGESFHRPGCALTTGKDGTEIDLATASARGLRPCPICDAVVASS